MTLGKGHVAYGERRHLVLIAAYWEELREQFKQDEIKLEEETWEGIILANFMQVPSSILTVLLSKRATKSSRREVDRFGVEGEHLQSCLRERDLLFCVT